jgi:hypothetical protein
MCYSKILRVNDRNGIEHIYSDLGGLVVNESVASRLDVFASRLSEEKTDLGRQ